MPSTVDQVLEKAGGFGLYQFLLLQIVGFADFCICGPQNAMITFIAGEPTWECVSNSTICNITGTIDTTSANYDARCSMPRSEWKFSDTFTSTVTEFDLICDRSFLQNLASSVFWLGYAMGNALFGYFADKYGRRTTIILTVICSTLAAWVVIWPRYLSVYILCRIIIGAMNAGVTMTGFVLLVEYSGIKYRSRAGTSFWYYSCTSSMLIALVAYLIREWRHLMLFAAALSTPYIFLVWFFPESCRYLLGNQRPDDAIEELKKVARLNKTAMAEIELEVPNDIENKKSDFRDLFYDTQVSKITVGSWILWFTCCLVFYTVAYGSIYLGGSIYLSFFLVSLMKSPAIPTSIFLMNKFGRRKALVAGLVVATISSATTVAIPTDRTNIGFSIGRILMAMVCQYSIAVSLYTSYVYSSELFPTSVRVVGLGTSSSWGRIGAFLALYVVWLIRIHALLPSGIIAVLCLITVLVCFKWLPETNNAPTRETLASVIVKRESVTLIHGEKKLHEKLHQFVTAI